MGKWIKCLRGNDVPGDQKRKEFRVKRVLRGLLLSAVFLVVVPHSSYAGICNCAGPGRHEEGVSAMGGMKHHDMGIKRPGHRMWSCLSILISTKNKKRQ
jgi:hypothetical protein